MSVAPLFNTYEKSEVMSLSDPPYYMEYYTLLMKTPDKKDSYMYMFLKPFTIKVWISLTGGVLLVALVLTFTENKCCQMISPEMCGTYSCCRTESVKRIKIYLDTVHLAFGHLCGQCKYNWNLFSFILYLTFPYLLTVS